MLNGLRIKDFAVIRETEVVLGPGLTVLTGETGAGKSILVDALSLLLGGRADPEVIRAGCEEAVVEGLFFRGPLLARRLEELGLPDLGEELSVRRIIGRSGRGKAYVNGALVTVGVLGKLMGGTVDIAGQHEHMSLFDVALHRELLDRAGGLDAPLVKYRERYASVRALTGELAALGGDEEHARQQSELLQFQLGEWERIEPSEGEDAALEAERKKLVAIERLRQCCAEGESLLGERDDSALELVDRAIVLLTEAAQLDAALAPNVGALNTARAELEQTVRAVSRHSAGLEADPDRLAQVEERLDGIKKLVRRHGGTLEAALRCRAELAQRLDALEHRRERQEALSSQLAQATALALEAGRELSGARLKVAEGLAAQVRGTLAHLALARSSFEVRVEPSEQMTPEGLDRVEFLFSANAGEPLRPLCKVASGGEIARVLLSLKVVLAGSDGCGCYVFDEADAGVGGAVAEVVGRLLKDASRHRQVLCITHVPQVAAFADAHLVVSKEERRGRTLSQVCALDPGAPRTQELARMLSGLEVTREALGAAEALMRSAARGARLTRGREPQRKSA